MPCYPSHEIVRFLDGGFSAAEATALDAHLQTCAACRETLAQRTRDATFESWLRRPRPPAAPTEPAVAEDDEQFLQRLRHAAEAALKDRTTPAPEDDSKPGAVPPSAASPEPPLPHVPGLQVLRPLGQGGMGIVFEAYDPHLRRQVAVKVLGRQRAPTEWLDRIRLEAEAAARLSHPHVVQIYAVGNADGQPYVILEYVSGGTLADRLQGRPQPPREAAALAAKLARAIHFAHERRVVHRDLKPRNVLIAEAGPHAAETPLSAVTPKITDFGLAKLLDSELQWTRSGQIMGTPAYAAPEQLNQTLGAVGPATDVYALGAILYEMLTGRVPLQADDIWRTVQLVLSADPVVPRHLQPGIPLDLETICLHCLAKEPSRRYASAAALADDLDRFRADQPIHARPLGRAARTWRWARRNRRLATALAAIAALLVLCTVGALTAAIYFRQLENRQRELADSNAALADDNAAARDEAQAANRRMQRTLADMYTASGFQASDDGKDREALLWFAHAALVRERLVAEQSARSLGLRPDPRPAATGEAAAPPASPDDDSDAEQLRTSVNRFRLSSRRLARPVAVFPNQAPVDRLFIHPSHRYVLMRPFLGQPGALWDVETEAPVALPPAAKGAHALAWTPDGKWLAIGRRDKVTLFRFPEFTEPQEIACGLGLRAGPAAETTAGSASQPTVPVGSETQPTLIERLEFDASGRYLAMASERVARVWDSAQHAFTGPPLPHPAPILCLAFSPDSQYLATSTLDARFRLFAVTASQAEPACAGPHVTNTSGWNFLAPRFTGDSRHLVTRPTGESLAVWEVAARRTVRTVTSRVGAIYSLEPTSTDGEMLVAGSNGLALMHPLRDVERTPLTAQAVVVAAYDRRQQLAIAGRPVRECQLWSLPAGRLQPCPAVHPAGCRSVAFSADGRYFATAGYDHNVRLWALPPPDPAGFTARVADGAFHLGAFSPDSRYLAVTAFCSTTQVYDTHTGQQVGRTEASDPPGSCGLSALLLPDNERLAVYQGLPDRTGRLDVWHWRTGNRLSATALAVGPQPLLYPVLCANRQGTRLVTLGSQGQAQVWDLTTPEGRSLRIWDGATTYKWFRLSPDGHWLAGATPTVGVCWNIETGEVRGRFEHRAEIVDAAFSRDGCFLATASRDETARVWDLKTQSPAADPFRHPGAVHFVDFSPDGRLLLTSGKDAAARVWDIASGKPAAAPINGAEDIVARFRADARQFVLTDYEGHFEAWDWRRRQRLLPTERLFWEPCFCWNSLRSLVLSPDGRFAAVGGGYALRVVNLEPLDAADLPPAQDLVTEAEVLSHLRLEDGTTANLTFAEWHDRWETLRAARRQRQVD